MVIEAVNGNPDATTDGIDIPLGVDGDGNPIMGKLCIGHYPDYSSDVSFSMNMGGQTITIKNIVLNPEVTDAMFAFPVTPASTEGDK